MADKTNWHVKYESPVINGFKIMIGDHLVYKRKGPTDIPTLVKQYAPSSSIKQIFISPTLFKN